MRLKVSSNLNVNLKFQPTFCIWIEQR